MKKGKNKPNARSRRRIREYKNGDRQPKNRKICCGKQSRKVSGLIIDLWRRNKKPKNSGKNMYKNKVMFNPNRKNEKTIKTARRTRLKYA